MYNELLTDVDVIPAQQAGLMDTMKEYLNPSKWMASLDKQKMIEMGVYFGVGVLLGFLMKKYANFLIAAAITVAAVVALHYVGFLDITVHMDRVEAWFGITMPSLQGDLSFHLMEWVKSHVNLVVSFVIGFLIGLKVG
jgi:uncharacterized membrane protein (Fun14 family)